MSAEPDIGRADKRASMIARQIEAEIVRRGWTVGESLGSEQALQQRFCVSRSVLREAVRLVEHHQVARMRRGPNGGLLICEPDAGPATRAVVIYLEYLGYDAGRPAQCAPGARTAGGLSGRGTHRRGRNRAAPSGAARRAAMEARPTGAPRRIPHSTRRAIEKPGLTTVYRCLDEADRTIRTPIADRLDK